LPLQRLTFIEPSDKKRTHTFASGRTGSLKVTGDGSLTVEDPVSGELFHNKAGAYTEALLNYVQASAALNRLKKQGQIAVLDVCFGLGYNSFVLICEALKNKLSATIKIHAIDSDPTLVDLIPTILAGEPLSAIATSFTRDVLASGQPVNLLLGDLRIEFQLQVQSLNQCLPKIGEDFDFVFHDPFSPRKMPELWSVEIFHHYFKLLKKRAGAVLTYSAAVAVRGGLSEAGFAVKRTASLGAKSGGTIGIARDNFAEFCFEELSEEELNRLAGRSAVPYRDPALSLDRLSVLARRSEELAHRGAGRL
jgi:tRNA U34 5-methylaminomethyl-2-thiouridine-forming methyltransferase MnmC